MSIAPAEESSTVVPFSETSEPATAAEDTPAATIQDEVEPSDSYEQRACYLFNKESGCRQFFIRMFEHPNFDRTVLAVIGLNCITLGAFDPTDPDCETDRCKILAIFDIIFSTFFILEMLVKMIAMGVFGPGAYFSTAWNKFDCFIVATSVVDFIGVQLTYLKVFRALRPLRAVNKFPKLKILVKLLLDTIPMMTSVGLLCFFIFSVYGILALQLWPGLTHQRCYTAQYPTDPYSYYAKDDDPDGGFICSSDDLDQGGYSSCTSAVDDDGTTYPYCLRAADMSKQFLVGGEAPNPFYGAISYDYIWYTWIAIFQVITMEGWVDQMYIVQGGYSFYGGVIYFCSLIVIGAFFSINLALVVIATQFGASKDSAQQEIIDDEMRERRVKEKERAALIAQGVDPDKSCWDKCSRSYDEKRQIIETRLQHIQALIESRPAEDPVSVEAVKGCEEINTTLKTKKSGNVGEHVTNTGIDLAMETPELEIECIEQGGFAHKRYKMRKFIELQLMDNIIMGCIGANVAMFATEYDGMTDDHETVLEILNYVFCGIFGLEAVWKLIAYLPTGYFKVGFNVFDFVIVVISFVEIGTGGGGGLSFLRMFRLVRLFRLVRFLPGLQFQLLVMLQTLGSVFSFLVLLGLFIFIYAVLGMFIFGNNLTFDGETDRKNFDTLYWGLITIFQVLTLEDWNAAMYAGVRYGGSWAAVYYISLIVFGNYIMFNLFIAILIDGFGGDINEEDDDDRDNYVSKSEAKNVLAAAVAVHTGTDTSSKVRSRRTTQHSSYDLEDTTSNSRPQTTGASSRELSGVGTGVGQAFGSFTDLGSGSGTGDLGSASDNSAVGFSDSGSGVAAVTPVDAPPATDSDEHPENTADKYLKQDSPPVSLPPTMGSNELSQEKPDVATPTDEKPQLYSDALANAKGTDKQQELEAEAVPCTERCCPGLYHKNHHLFCLGPENKLRLQCHRIMVHPLFDQIIIGLIIANSIFMGIESPDIDDDSALRTVLTVANDVFCFLFLGEMLIKWCAMGVFIGPDTYLDDGWNRLDCFIVTVSLVDFVMSKAGVSGGLLSMLKICRMLRALRPLRAINKLPNLKRVVNTLVSALDPIGTTLIIIFAFFFIFGILGCQIFMGQFYYCDLADGSGDCEAPRTFCTIKTKAECEAGGNTWRNESYNFDHLGRAFMTLFVLASIDGWVEIMYNGVDINGKDKQPVRNESEYLAVFFVIFLLVGGFFIINMFVGVIVDNFQKNGKKADPTPEELQAAKEAQEAHDYAVEHENDFLADVSPARYKLWEFALGQKFEIFIAAVIILNVVTMGMEHYDMTDGFKMFLRITNYLFTAIFVFEMVVKQIALGLPRYHCGLNKNWNNFDVFIVVISVLGILIDDVIGSDNVPIDPSMLKVLRILRVARILKLLKNAKDLMVLLNVVAQSLSQVGNLALLLFLAFFIYAALGIELFGKICTDDTLTECNSIGSFAHFRNFGMSMLVLFRLSTGDNWNGIMKDAMLEAPYCDDSGEDCEKNCCANTLIAPLYFISFCLVSTFVMLNLVIAVLMAELENAENDPDLQGPADDVETDVVAIHPGVEVKKSDEETKVDIGSKKDLDAKVNPAIETEETEETTDTLEKQVNDVLQAEPEKKPSPDHLDVDTELEEIVSYQPTLPPLEHASATKDPATPGRPSNFVPFAPALVVSDEPEQP